MAEGLRSFVRRHPLSSYVVLTYAISWSIFIPLALKKHGVLDLPLPYPLYYCASYGPMIAALVVTGLLYGRSGLRDIAGRMFQWRVGTTWLLVGLSPLILYALTAVLLFALQGTWIEPATLGQIEFLPDLGLGALVLWLLTYGIGEETGWRGFLLPHLQRNRSALASTALLWLAWATWHAPAFFLVYDPIILPGFLPSLFAGAVFFTWLYNSTRGSIFIVALWHGIFNFTTASKASKAGVVSTVVSTLVVLWALLVVVIYKPTNLSPQERQKAA